MRSACLALLLPFATRLAAAEFHVSPAGDDANSGVPSSMLRTISEAANRAQPGDTVTVHEGVYRERINPPRGGTGDNARIVYQAAAGENVVIKGSEIVTGWEFVGNDTWKITRPNSYFGAFNPFADLISGDWFTSNGRSHHTGSVYLNGHWLTEAANKTLVLQAAGGSPLWFAETGGTGSLLNIAWLQPHVGAAAGTRVDASYFDRDFGVTIAPCSEGSDCVGWIDSGDWTRYDTVDFGTNADSLKLRVASATTGGTIEVRLNDPAGTLLGTTIVANTGGWQTWTTVTATITPTSGIQRVCLVYRSPVYTAGNTTIWAQFPGKDPNQELTEINARQCVFYPEESGIDYLTIRGFTLEQAATPWAPPTAEQRGLIGTHWGKGWIIENNTVRYSVCSGIALGKYGDRYDNIATALAANGAAPYVETIQRALANGWNKDDTGGHVVRGNHISHCEQTGIVGSLGCAFSTIENNHIHDIHIRRLFGGAEMAGIKFHGAIDTRLSGNHIHQTVLGIWLDWMAQGTQVSRGLLHDNSRDLFLEVDHGPTLVERNIFLSGNAILDVSQGEAYVHNLIAGAIQFTPDNNRDTPYHPAHDTAISGLAKVTGGDTRFFNNLFAGSASLAAYNNAARPTPMDGNVFLKNAVASSRETLPLSLPTHDLAVKLSAGASGYYLEMNVDPAWRSARNRPLVTTALLGNAMVPNTPFEQPDGTPLTFDTDFTGQARAANPFPGPFEIGDGPAGKQVWKVSSVATLPTPGARVMERIHIEINAASPVGTAGNFTGTPATTLGEAGETWNHITPGAGSAGSASLRNSAGEATTVSIKWSANHGTFDNSTAAANYTDLLGDYVYVHNGNGGQPASTWTFTGLAAYGTYDLVLYSGIGSLSGARWTVGGDTKEAAPIGSAASLNVGQEFVRFDGLRTNGAGEIRIDFGIRDGKSFGEMAGLELETVALTDAPPTGVSQTRFNGGAFEITAIGLLPGNRYMLTRSADLRDGLPTVVGSAFLPENSTEVLSDLDPPAGRAFYRIEELP